MIHLTSNAKEHLSKLLAQKASSEESGLRLYVEKGGCAGMQYAMKVAEQEAGDKVFGDGDARVFVDAESLEFLNGRRSIIRIA